MASFGAMLRRAALLVSVSIAIGPLACEDSETSTPALDAGGPPPVGAFPEAGPLPEASTTPEDAGRSCHTVTQQAEPLTYVSRTAAAPTPAGGTVTEGVYVLTEFAVHTDAFPDGTALLEIGRTTARITGQEIHVLLTRPNGETLRNTETFAFSGTTVTSTQTCVDPAPDGGASPAPRTAGYTATPTSFTLVLPTPNGPIVNTYTKR